ncbi:uncharacterized protein BJX67DRAFT_166568 [Aspergillus lucknowensis]|uniref:Mid2 domain-containing protein n=1 Tax=Aspergillus lucknowensis TaxID=176173 RepID=A0ABR4M4R8_9EURO
MSPSSSTAALLQLGLKNSRSSKAAGGLPCRLLLASPFLSTTAVEVDLFNGLKATREMADSASITTAPLTSIFTPPPECSTSWTFERSAYNGVENGLFVQNVVSTDLDTSCFPSGFNQVGRATTDDTFFSPGACPAGYTTNTGATTVASTTTASCCLSDYYFLISDSQQGCVSTFTGTTFVAARAGGLGSDVDLTTSTTASGTIQMWAQPITIMYQESDLSYYTSTSSSSVSTTPSSSTITTTSPPRPDSDTSSDSGTLSGGAKAGIAVGSIVGALLLLGLGFVFWRRLGKKKAQAMGSIQGGVQEGYGPGYKDQRSPYLLSELDAQNVRQQERPAEVE